MAEQRYQVSRPWDSQLRTADQSPKALPPNTHIADVFDRRDVGGKLLILGNPGSGKTTTMLDLAAVLIQRANDDPQQPIPVMVNLSSWQNANQSLIDWLINELKLKYGVSPKLGKTWLAQKTLLPLLDGLDELPPVRQEPVVQAINDWLQSGDGPTTLLICSRFEEYELYETQLGLNAAICLEPLTDAQLQDYLHALNSDYLWQTLHHDKELLALVRTPLLLSVTMLAQDGLDAQQWQQKPTTIARLEYLLDAYIERRLHEQIRSAEYSMASLSLAKRTRARLVWLAQNLSTSFIDSFSTEEIQSEILDWKIRRVYEVVSSIGFGVLIALIHYLLSTFLFDLISLHFFEIFEPSQGRINEESLEGFIYPYFQGVLWSGVFSGAVGTHFGFRVSRNNIEFTETISIQEIKFHSFKKWMLLGFSWGCIFMLSTSVASLGYWLNSPRLVTMYRNYSVESAQELSIQSIVQAFEYLNNLFLVYLFFLAFFWMVFWIFFGVFKGLGRKAESKVSPHQGMQQNFKLILNSFLLFCGLFMMSFLGFYLSTQEPNINLQDIFKFTFLGVFCSLLMSIASVGWPCIQHFILRLLLFRSQDIPWNYTRFLNYCTDRLLLQRVGGRYRFIHKLLQEHFAAMPLR
ncbi:MAG: NACHT domain-containing protein [Cyanobacteria bacterium P01_D01_bin.71]